MTSLKKSIKLKKKSYFVSNQYVLYSLNHAGHTRKASRISKTVVDNCDKGVGNFDLS